jgi:hypothetical protein
VYEDTSAQRGCHSVWWLAGGQKHRKGPHSGPNCHTCFSKENQVQTYMHARIKFHAYSDI